MVLSRVLNSTQTDVTLSITERGKAMSQDSGHGLLVLHSAAWHLCMVHHGTVFGWCPFATQWSPAIEVHHSGFPQSNLWRVRCHLGAAVRPAFPESDRKAAALTSGTSGATKAGGYLGGRGQQKGRSYSHIKYVHERHTQKGRSYSHIRKAHHITTYDCIRACLLVDVSTIT